MVLMIARDVVVVVVVMANHIYAWETLHQQPLPHSTYALESISLEASHLCPAPYLMGLAKLAGQLGRCFVVLVWDGGFPRCLSVRIASG
jgi:hypothetical protein